MTRRMTKKDAIADFEENIIPWIRETYEQDGERDLIARREAWNDYTDSLCKDGQISDKQYETWDHPAICG